VTPSMEHLQDRDPAWTDAGLTIRYSGPAELVVQEERKPVYTRKLSFEKGLLRAVENPEGELEQAPLRLYVAGNDRPLSEEESFYELRHGQSAFIQVEAGSRRFRSETWRIPDAAEVSLQPPRQLILELQEGVDRVVHDFEAVATPPGDYIYLWNLDDASALVEERPDPGSHSRQSHLYTGLQPGDAFTPTVTLMDRRGRILGEDSISITVIEGAGRHFFENEVFWKTDTPFANDPSVVFPEVPLHLETEITGLEGTIDPGSPEGRRLAELRAGPGAKTEEVIKERMHQEMARRGITLSDAQMNAALQQALALAGTGTAEQMDRRMPLLASGYREPGTPVTVSLTLSLPAIPRIPLSMTDSRGDPVRLDAQVTVRGWFLTLGTASGPRESGNSGRTTVVWTPPKGAADAFAANLVMMYSLEFYTRGTRELWLDGGSPVVYENLSVSLPVGTVFCPPGDPSDRGGVP
ncbi:MAG: hypothetical protein K9L28_06700, partial [Synergistales bacterium]|nr:hypothetical protein [Synergistales bacterium]